MPENPPEFVDILDDREHLQLGAGSAYASPLTLGGVEVAWTSGTDEVAPSISVPTDGWVAIGFNTRDTIVGAEPFMMRLRNGRAEGSHRYVAAAGDLRKVEWFKRLSIVSRIAGQFQ